MSSRPAKQDLSRLPSLDRFLERDSSYSSLEGLTNAEDDSGPDARSTSTQVRNQAMGNNARSRPPSRQALLPPRNDMKSPIPRPSSREPLLRRKDVERRPPMAQQQAQLPSVQQQAQLPSKQYRVRHPTMHHQGRYPLTQPQARHPSMHYQTRQTLVQHQVLEQQRQPEGLTAAFVRYCRCIASCCGCRHDKEEEDDVEYIFEI
ncbi:hypothetical protein MGN70_007400 [Eutypa lata]|nr:hypothetical protein MGN70_007400 [Eutypa lata]